jgi:hypothetical protein
MATIPAVHLAENVKGAQRALTTARAYPLGEPGRPTRSGGLAAIVHYLNVESSPRYARTAHNTFCNIYACDYCYLAGAYLPRVWWTTGALAKLAAGTPVQPKYGETVIELNVNALHDWLGDFGPSFGWRRVETLDELQAAANAGNVALICAQRKQPDRSGHISVVVPESSDQAAERSSERVRLPLQSQAGARNVCFGCGLSKWWAGAQFRRFGFWVHP